MEKVIVKFFEEGDTEQTVECNIALLLLADINEDGQTLQVVQIAKEVSLLDLMIFYTNAMSAVKSQATEFQLETFEKWMKERK